MKYVRKIELRGKYFLTVLVESTGENSLIQNLTSSLTLICKMQSDFECQILGSKTKLHLIY